jgi:hypothetical protein
MGLALECSWSCPLEPAGALDARDRWTGKDRWLLLAGMAIDFLLPARHCRLLCILISTAIGALPAICVIMYGLKQSSLLSLMLLSALAAKDTKRTIVRILSPIAGSIANQTV